MLALTQPDQRSSQVVIAGMNAESSMKAPLAGLLVGCERGLYSHAATAAQTCAAHSEQAPTAPRPSHSAGEPSAPHAEAPAHTLRGLIWPTRSLMGSSKAASAEAWVKRWRQSSMA